MNRALSIRDSREGNWFFVDNKLLREYGRLLGPHGVAVYNVLAMHSNSQTQQAEPSFNTIAKMLNMSRRHVIRMAELLQKYNIIDIKKRTYLSKNGKTLHHPSLITLLKPDVWIAADYTQPSDCESPPKEALKPSDPKDLVTVSHQPSDQESPHLVTVSHTNKTKQNNTRQAYRSSSFTGLQKRIPTMAAQECVSRHNQYRW
jgi:hypothetical protein